MALTTRQKDEIKRRIRTVFYKGIYVEQRVNEPIRKGTRQFLKDIMEVFEAFIDARDKEYYPKPPNGCGERAIKKKSRKRFYARHNTLDEPELRQLILVRTKEGVAPIGAVRRTFPDFSEKKAREYIFSVLEGAKN